MIAPWLSTKIKALYIQGHLERDIKEWLGIDGFTLKHAIRTSWKTKERQRLYRQKLRINTRS
jgi:hypothetical protein